MTEVVPFRGLVYNNEKVSGDDVIAPPYDVITPEMRDALYSRSPYNIIKVDAGLDLPGDGEGENKYTRAAAHLEAWKAEGVLRRDPAPAYYACGIEYSAGGERKSLLGFFGLVKLVELGKGVYPHEATHSKPKKDRLSLIRHTRANTSPIYSLISGQGPGVGEMLEKASSGAPELEATDPDGTIHRFWPVRGPGEVEAMKSALSDVSVFIADGHHRYETALEYQRLKREEEGNPQEDRPYDFVLMFLADVRDPGLTVLPTHRLVTVDAEGMRETLESRFEISALSNGSDLMETIAGQEHAFGLYDGKKEYVLACRGDCSAGDAPAAMARLDVVVLHKLVFGSLLEVGAWGYEMDPSTARRMVDEGEYDAAFFLNPTKVEEVERVALASLRMPPKSTYFYPKVQTGFVINDLNSF